MKDYDYSTQAKYYDILEENPSVEYFNEVLADLLKKYKVKKVLDLTCGTGAQAIYLHKKGYSVTASDFNKEMIGVAQNKYSKIRFHQADMRSVKFGEFDAVISIFNAIGHLSKSDFEKTILNVKENLNEKGLYIFDIFNLDYMKNNFNSYEFIDVCKEIEETKYVRFNKNKLDKERGVMTVNQRTYIQKGMDKPKILEESWDMQIYSSEQLKEILEKNGFEIVESLDMDGKRFNKDKSLFILTVAKKKKQNP